MVASGSLPPDVPPDFYARVARIARKLGAKFVLDTSGSMSGFPIEKAKETMKLALDNLYPADTFNLITFSGDQHILFPEPVPATKENLAKAQAFLETRQGGGGTEMMKAIKGGVTVAPSPTPAKINPLARRRSCDGIHAATMQLLENETKFRSFLEYQWLAQFKHRAMLLPDLRDKDLQDRQSLTLR